MTKRRDLPRCMYQKHGRYWLVKRNKWHQLSSNLKDALVEYAELTTNTQGGLDELIDRTLKAHKGNVKPGTYQNYLRCARRIKSAFRNGSPNTVKPRHIAQFLDHHKPSVSNVMRSLLKVAFANAVRWGMADSNPVKDIERITEAPRKRYLTDAEFLAIREKADYRLQLIMDMMYLTGQRPGDVLNIRRSDIKGDKIFFEQQKTGNLVEIESDAIPELVQEIIQSRRAESFYLFHQGRGQPYQVKTVSRMFRIACRDAKVEDAQLRDIRAKSATDANEKGLNATRLLGHSDKRTTKIYLRKQRTIKAKGHGILRQ